MVEVNHEEILRDKLFSFAQKTSNIFSAERELGEPAKHGELEDGKLLIFITSL